MMKTLHFVVVVAAVSGSTVAPHRPIHAQATDLSRLMLENARNQLREKRYADGVTELGRVVAQYPNTSVAADALLELATFHFEVSGDLDAANNAVDALISTYRTFDAAPMGHVISGRILLAQSRQPQHLQTALTRFESVGSVYPKSDSVPMAAYYAGETLRITGRPKEAVGRFQTVVSQYPRSPWASRALLATALSYVSLDRPLPAMEALQQVRLRFPDTPEALTALKWNTQLCRLHVRPQANQQPYEFSGHTIPEAGRKLEAINVLATDVGDNLFAAGGGRLFVFSHEGAAMAAPTSLEPRSVFLDGKGHAAVLQKGSLRTEGREPLALKVPRPDGSPRVLEDASTAAAWSTGEYLVVDPSGIWKFSQDGSSLGCLSTTRLHRVAVNGLDEVAALDREAKSIVFLGRDGRIVRTIPAKGTGYELHNPVDLRFDALGHLLVLDRGRSSVLAFSGSGRHLTTFTLDERASGAFRRADALSLDTSGRLFIYDDGAKRVQIYH